MDNGLFVNQCKELVRKYVDKELRDALAEDWDYGVYVVWLSKVLQNNKALLSTTLADGLYFEITYNGEEDEYYFDVYKKIMNKKC